MMMNICKSLSIIILIGSVSCNPKKEPLSESPAATAAPVEKPSGQKENQIPQITLIEENGRQFSASTLPGNAIIIFFSSDCDHCQREATSIEQNIAGFSKYTIYFVSMNPFPEMRKFAETYKMNNKPNVQFFRADGKSVFDAMGSIQTPTICVFNKDKQLKKRFDGETKVADILSVL